MDSKENQNTFQAEFPDGNEEKQVEQLAFKQRKENSQKIIQPEIGEIGHFWERNSKKKDVLENSNEDISTSKKKKKQKSSKRKQIGVQEQFGAILNHKQEWLIIFHNPKQREKALSSKKNEYSFPFKFYNIDFWKQDERMIHAGLVEKMIELSEYILSESKESRVIVRSLPVIYLSGIAKQKYYLHSHGNKQVNYYSELLNIKNHQLVTHIEFVSIEQDYLSHADQVLINQNDENQQLMRQQYPQQQQSSWLSVPLEPFLSFRIDHYDGYLHRNMIGSCGACKRKYIQGNRIIQLPCQHIYHSRCALNLLYQGSNQQNNGIILSSRNCMICDVPFKLSHQHDVLSLNVVLPKPDEDQLLVAREKNGKQNQGIINMEGDIERIRKDQLQNKIKSYKNESQSMNLIDRNNCRLLKVVQQSEVSIRRQETANQLEINGNCNQQSYQQQLLSRQQRNLGKVQQQDNKCRLKCQQLQFCCQDHGNIKVDFADGFNTSQGCDTQTFQDLNKK